MNVMRDFEYRFSVERKASKDKREEEHGQAFSAFGQAL